jgi:PAS domain S-box-containing protein
MNDQSTAHMRNTPDIPAPGGPAEIRSTWLLWLIFGLGYLLCAKLADMLTVPQTNVSFVYLPVGVMIAACIRYGYRVWPAIVIGSFPAVLPFLLGNYTLPQSLLIASIQVFADVVQVVLGTRWYFRSGGGQNPMRSVDDVMHFIVYAALGAQAVGATIGVAGLMLGGKIALHLVPGIWMSWWISNVVSVLCIAPFLLLRFSQSAETRSRRRYVLHGVYYLATGLAASVVFFYRTPWTHLYFEYSAIMIAVAAAFVLSHRGTSTVAAIIATVAVASTTFAMGPFNVESKGESLLLLETFLVLLSGMSLVISATLAERERAKDELRRSAEVFRAAFDDANVGVCMVNTAGNFISVNRTYCDFLGYTPDELFGRGFNDVTVEEDRAVGKQLLDRMVQGEIPSAVFEKRYRKKDGKALWVSIATAMVRTSEGRPEHFVTYVQDITERKRAEDALRESEERYQQLFELSPDAVAVHAEGRILLANAAAVRTLGAECRDQIVGRMVLDVVDPEFHAVVQQRIEKEIRELETVPTLEERFIRVDGRPIDVEVTAAPVPHGGRTVSLVVFRDITERKRAERRQRALYEISRAANEADTSDELFAAVHRTISSVTNAKNFYIALYDHHTDTISFPYFADEVDENPGPRKAGKGLTEYVLRTGRSLLCDDATDAQLREAGEIELLGVPSPVWLGVPLMAGKSVLGAMVIQDHHDPHAFGPPDLQVLEFVSEQTAKSIERQEHVAQLRASLAEKGVLLKEIHHRVKNNMQVISSLLNLEAQQLPEGQMHQILTESISRIRSMAMVHETLYQSDNMASIEFGEYVRSVTAGLMRSMNRSGVALIVKAGKVHLDIDKAIPCGLIINELVSNALKHAFPDGRSGKVEVSLRTLPEGKVEMAVQDDGVGFPAGNEMDDMTSMGMTLVTSLARQILGSVILERNSGTRFTVTFPSAART